jgi:hypothetical protein
MTTNEGHQVMLQHSAFRGDIFRRIVVITRVLVDFDSW